jgi:hypothetical protein
MYTIEDNHDQRPMRQIFPAVSNRPVVYCNNSSSNNSIEYNDDYNTMYQKKLESYYHHVNKRSKPAHSTNEKDWMVDWGFEFHSNNHNYHDISSDRTTIDTTTKSVRNDKDHGLNAMIMGNYFPSTIDEVTDAVVATIAAVLQPSPSTQQQQQQSSSITKTTIRQFDPNILHNTVYSDNIIMSQRPVRHPQRDMGRIGIELDWSIPAITPSSTTSNVGIDECFDSRFNVQDHSTIRYASLILAGKLSTHCVSNHPVTVSKRKKSLSSQSQQEQQSTCRPIAIYYNTVQQALVASRQLLQLKRLERFRQSQQQQPPTHQPSIYDAIHIRSLCQDIDIPDALMNATNTEQHQKMYTTKLGRRLSSGQMEPITSDTGMILIVQPTNYNDEFRPPGPAINVLESIQRLVSIAAIEQLPVIMISPRFLKGPSFSSLSSSSSLLSGHWDQSGYYQQASFYAGLEPPPGPTPWILRDFTPPIFSYVANALSCKIPLNNHRRMNYDNNTYYRNMVVNNDNRGAYYYSHLALWQSVLHQGHGWNVFAAIRRVPERTLDDRSTGSKQSSKFLTYHKIGTSNNAAGRPTRQLLRRIWNEYIDTKTPI